MAKNDKRNTVNITQHRQLKTKQHKPHQKNPGVILGAREGQENHASDLAPVVLLIKYKPGDGL